MSMHAPCLSEAVARSYADPHCSSSSSISPPIRPPLSMRRKRRFNSTARSVISSLLLILLALPIASAIFDPGQADDVVEGPITSIVPERPKVSSSGGSSISLIAPKGHPISLHPGCKRTTDLFDNVCHNPWSPFSTGHRKSHSAGHSELVICPVGETNENGEKERVFAITGTITLPASTAADLEAASPSVISSATLGDKEAYWPKPGDEGFWRQRDGELEWVPTEVRALLESVPIEGDVTPAITTKTEEVKAESSKSPEVAHAEEYHAWSESVGGEESKTWLSFEQWREHHLAAEKEQEKQRIAAGKKQKHDKAKEKKAAQGQGNNASEKVSEVHSNGSIDNLNTTIIGGIQNSTNLQTSSDPLPERPSDDHLTEQDAQTGGKPQLDSPREATDENSVEPSVVKVDTSQDTGTIPAIADASSLLSTLKHRWNFASFDCAAVVHRANPSAKFTSAILSEKKDRYMLSPCSQGDNDPQFVVVELCDEISVDTIVLANYEFFSRMFKRFRVRVARNLNGGEADWYDIGTFRARNVRGLQVFNTVPPKADSRFFRYVRIDFLEHYGSEFYCPVSLLRVYGLTQMDDYIREEEEMRRQREAELTLADSESVDEDDEEEMVEGAKEGEAKAEIAPSSSSTEAQPTEKSEQAVESVMSTSADSAPTSFLSASVAAITSALSSEQPTQTSEASSETVSSSSSTIAHNNTKHSPANVNSTHSNVSETINSSTEALLQGAEGDLSRPAIDLAKVYVNKTVSEVADQGDQMANASDVKNVTVSREAPSINNTAAIPTPAMTNSSSTEFLSAVSSDATTASLSSSGDVKERASNVTSSTSSISQSVPSSEASKPAATGQQQQQQQQNAGGSESIYRTITKRLNILEMNATLSLQYMEHSRQQLGEVFSRMERNQRDKIAEMLKELNASNWRQIESLKRRQQVDLQQAIFEFDKHRQQTDAERRQLLAQVHILSNEVILEKRFGIAQLVLLLGLFVFMALTRGSKAAPLIHQGIARISTRSSPGIQRDPLLSPPGKSRASQGVQSDVKRVLPSPSPGGMRQLQPYRPFLTPRHDKHNRGLERAIPLRGHSHSKTPSARGPKSAGLLTLSPVPVRKMKTASISSSKSHHRDSDSASSSLQDHATSSILNVPVSRPVIKLDTDIKAEEAELETPIVQYASRVRSSAFKREDTPTNLSEARHFDMVPPLLPPSTSGLSLSESYGSDWGTERSDDEDESHTSCDLHNEQTTLHGNAGSVTSAAPSSSSTSTPVMPPLRNPLDRFEESDAEEDSPKWNSVKSRRSLKRPNSSSGNSNANGWHPQLSNGLSRGHTPPNHLLPTPTRRSFSPFHKNAEIEIN